MKVWAVQSFSQLEDPSCHIDMVADSELQCGVISHSENRYKEVTPAPLFLLLGEEQALKHRVFFFRAGNSETQRQNPASQLGHGEQKVRGLAMNEAPKTNSALL